MIHHGLISCVLAIGIVLSDPVFAQDTTLQHTTMRITIASRNGGELLAQAIIELAALRKEDVFKRVLSRRTGSDNSDECELAARRDASGRVFDLARCVDVWPTDDKAPLSKVFERNFSDEAMANGVQAFPAVKVIAYEFPLRLTASQFPANRKQSNLSIDGGGLKPSPSFHRMLCNRRVTFISPEACKVRVVPRLDAYHTDVYVTQTGYHINLTNPISIDVATALGERLNKRFEAAQKLAPGSIAISIFQGDAGVGQQAPTDRAAKPAEVKKIRDLWASLGSSPDELSLFGPANPRPPTLLVFDKRKLEEPVLMWDWFQDFNKRAITLQSENCPEINDDISHADAVASLLFPASMIGRLNGVPPTGSLVDSGYPSPEWNGYFMSTDHFREIPAVDNLMWHEKVFAEPGEPLIGLVVYSSEYQSSVLNAAKNAVDKYLTDRSNLLVVSAPQKIRNGQVQEFSPGPETPITNSDEIEAYCQGRAWPACLGRHPRVLVIASTNYPAGADSGPTLFKPDDYVLGASTVRLAAPGGDIPVARSCTSNTAHSWNLAPANGTSFAAPIVALVLSRIIQLAPERVKIEAPEAAIWRVLATANPIEKLTPSGGRNVATQFGQLDAGRALRGASAKDSGEDDYAMLYEKNGTEKETASRAVVMPFPWNDHQQTISKRGLKYGLQTENRGRIAFKQMKEDGGEGAIESIEFARMLRIVRRPGDHLDGLPLFDIFYLIKNADLIENSVATRKRVRLGSSNAIDAPGYCRSDGITSRGEGDASNVPQSQPACLYVWRANTTQFEPLDMNSVTDIVFPLLHVVSDFPERISPTNVTAITSPLSPWRTAFCDTRPRRKVTQLLTAKLGQISPDSLCAP